ncbi:hypothetical protein [Burkholderia glumae]|uniref:hypothetical protein n=1 Tax=Burkholderia glumae TaxID=337 RepID=UPI000382C824|nr:hypothetical protein [Burkholderia glumae]MCM2494204.1 hypothetical protein [Burkholderia glumae]MCM2545153.1 hypothetical protein [Burkholderia glumae]QHE12419.1 hypothetical protein GQR88_18705 [Burkholderia glumae AU6208]
MPVSPSNALDIARLAVSVLTPLSVTALGWLISRRLKRLELVQWTNQKLIEKRLAIYDIIAPQLNALLCFYTWVGYWKDISPDDVIRIKRDLDRTLHVYRHLFDDEVYHTYHALMLALFDVHSGAGRDARIRSLVTGPNGDRTVHGNYAWHASWSERFAIAKVLPGDEIQSRYYRLMDALRGSLGANR